ncbi:MAG: sigma factor, partial [Steroidobacteraceae bacterium]
MAGSPFDKDTGTATEEAEESLNFQIVSGSIQVAALRPYPCEEKARMSADVSDLSLVRRVQRGDKGAFDALVLKYQHKLVKLVMRYVRNPAEAEDIAQEAF